MEIIKVRIEELVPYSGNVKLHPREQIEQIKESISRFGNNDPIAIDQNNVIIEGHGRLLALKELGYEYAECIRLAHLTDEQRRAYTLIHNKLTMNSDFDLDLLAEELKQIESIDMGSFDLSLGDVDMGEDAGPLTLESAEIEEVEVPEIKKSERVKPGQIWKLGKHRLMVGDSTNPQDVAKLMDGSKADLLLTDPPYNVNYEGSAGKIQNDNMADADFRAFLCKFLKVAMDVMKPGAGFYIWHADSEGYNFRAAVRDAGLQIRQCLIWKKHQLVLGRQDYQWIHEPCLYGWKDGAAHYFIPDRKQTTFISELSDTEFDAMSREELVSVLTDICKRGIATTVIEEDRPKKSDLHPTMKPVKLMARQVVNSTKPGWKVLDVFGGSGSTLIACEQLGRICYTMELDVNYADAILRRFEGLTGQTAELVE